MNITDFTLKLIFILIPGAMASLIFEKLTVHRPWNSFKFTAHSILFGLLAYLSTDWFINAINKIFNARWRALSILNTLTDNAIPFIEIGKATVAGVLIGLISSAVDHHKWINRIAHYLNISNKIGDINLYSHFLTARDIIIVQLRDTVTNQTYKGIVGGYFETDEFKEIVLFDVAVYSNEKEGNSELTELYRLKALYLSRPKDEILIEVP